MPIIGEKIFDVQLVSIQGTELCYQNMLYAPIVAATDEPILDFANAFIADVIPAVQAMSSAAISYIEARVKSRAPTGGEVLNVPLAFTGSIVGDAMPPWDTISIRKNPSTTIEGTNQTAFDPGRLSFSGLPESGQVGGLFTLAQLVLVQDTCDALFEVVVNGSTYRFYMERNDSDLTPPESAAFLTSLSPRRVGTQLTRKR